MKKIVSLILAVMMIASLTVTAFATTSDTTLTQKSPKSTYDAESEEGTVNTELWLQVDAKGQIDVTVPLVLVFKTDIDGGEATGPSTYKITNNSTAKLAVTAIDVTKSNVDTIANVAKAYFENAQDTYYATLTVGSDEFDLNENHAKDQIEGGLFTIDKNAATTDITAFMKTGALTFITSRLTTDGKDAGMDESKGIQLMNIAYTVAIDTSDAFGDLITNQNQNLPAANP